MMKYDKNLITQHWDRANSYSSRFSLLSRIYMVLLGFSGYIQFTLLLLFLLFDLGQYFGASFSYSFLANLQERKEYPTRRPPIVNLIGYLCYWAKAAVVFVSIISIV